MPGKIKDEKQVYARLRQRWPKADWQRFENGFGSGIPDVNGCFDAMEIWFECKVGKIGRHNTLTVDLRPRQRAWIKRRCAVGGAVYVAIAIDDAVVLVNAHNLDRLDNKDDLGAWLKLGTPLETALWDQLGGP